MADPNWLLSAVAQSTAALVAIVGGLIVSRLIGLSSERSALERQLRHLRDRRDTLEVETAGRREWLVSDDLKLSEVMDWVIAIFETDGDMTDENLLEVAAPGRWEPADYAPHLEEIRQIVADAVAAYEPVRDLIGADSPMPLTFAEMIRTTEVEAPENSWVQGIWEKVWDLWRRRERQRTRKAMGDVASLFAHSMGLGEAMSARMLVPPPAIPDVRRHQEERDYVSVVAQLESTKQEIKRLSEDLEDVVQPPGLWQGFWVLSAFAVVGIVLPVVVMATLPRELHVGLRAAVVLLFVAGLVALLGYIAWFAQQLRS